VTGEQVTTDAPTLGNIRQTPLNGRQRSTARRLSIKAWEQGCFERAGHAARHVASPPQPETMFHEQDPAPLFGDQPTHLAKCLAVQLQSVDFEGWPRHASFE